MRIPAFKLSFQVETDNACGVISSAIIRQNEFDQICVSIPTGLYINKCHEVSLTILGILVRSRFEGK